MKMKMMRQWFDYIHYYLDLFVGENDDLDNEDRD